MDTTTTTFAFSTDFGTQDFSTVKEGDSILIKENHRYGRTEILTGTVVRVTKTQVKVNYPQENSSGNMVDRTETFDRFTGNFRGYNWTNPKGWTELILDTPFTRWVIACREAKDTFQPLMNTINSGIWEEQSRIEKLRTEGNTYSQETVEKLQRIWNQLKEVK